MREYSVCVSQSLFRGHAGDALHTGAEECESPSSIRLGNELVEKSLRQIIADLTELRLPILQFALGALPLGDIDHHG